MFHSIKKHRHFKGGLAAAFLILLFSITACNQDKLNSGPELKSGSGSDLYQSSSPAKRKTVILSEQTLRKNPPGLFIDFQVANGAELQLAMDLSEPGDTIEVLNGFYTDVTATMRPENSGNAANRIRIFAQDRGLVIFRGNTHIDIRASYITVEGLTFMDGQPTQVRGAIALRGTHSIFQDSVIENFNRSGYRFITIYEVSNTVQYNLFENKTTRGVMFAVDRNDDRPNYHIIRGNHFKTFADGGGENGWETLRIGDSTYSQSDSYTTVENNLFEDVDGEIEIISIKSGRNVIRGNTIRNSKGHITSRHGKANLIENNVILTEGKRDAGGIRFYDGEHIIRNNYIEGVDTGSDTRGGIVVHSGVNDPDDPSDLPAVNGRWTPYDVTIERNTIVNGRQSFVYDEKDLATRIMAHDVVFSNNVVNTGGFSSHPVIRANPLAPLVNPVYSGELYWGETLGIPSEPGIDYRYFELTRNSDGLLLHPEKGAQNIRPLQPSEVGPRS